MLMADETITKELWQANMTTIKEIYLLLDRISKGFSIKIKKKDGTTPRNTL